MICKKQEGIEMKRDLKYAVVAVWMTLLLAGGACAAEGLDSFVDSRSMDGTTFADVKTTSWFYSGVKSAYDMMIMEGMGGGRFEPNQTVPWSQAVTIAARVRAAYLGEEIPAAEGAWYQQYVDYAAASGILPANHPDGAAWNTTAIDRQSIAYLFQAVVGKEDCPPVSNLTIPDLAAVSNDKQAAVQSLYAAGIFTGKSGGNFDPTGLTTRAELATILTRLLRPAYRVAYDSRVNTDMVGQESNFTHSGGLCYDDGAVYLIYREDVPDGVEYQHILRRDKKTGQVTTLYSSDGTKYGNLYDLYLCDGYLYFTEKDANGNRAFKRISIDGDEAEKLCSTPKNNSLDYFLVYDNRIFTLQSQMMGSDFVYTLGELKGNSIQALGKYYRADSIYGFNGKIYVAADYGNELHAYDLTTGKTEKLIEGMETCVFNGGNIYFLLWDNGDYSNQIWMASLADPARAVKYGTVPESALTHYVNLAHDGKDLYYIASSSYVLYRIAPGQEAEKVLTNRFGTVENPIIWDDCFLAGNPGLSVGGNYTGEYPVTTGIGTPNVFRTNVDHWLGYSALMVRTAFPQSGKAYTNDAPLAEGDCLAVHKAYYSGDALVLDVDYYNPDTAKIRTIRNMDVTLKAGGVTLAEDVRVVDGEDVKPGKTGKFTIVIQGEDLLAAGVDLGDLDWKIGVSYNLYNT